MRSDDRLRGKPPGGRLQGQQPQRRGRLRLRLLLPRRRGGAGLSSLRRLRPAALLPALALAFAPAALTFLLAGCGGVIASREPWRSRRAPLPQRTSARRRSARLRTTDLLWDPAAPSAPDPAAFGAARARLSALHPAYLRLLANWAALQPDPNSPAALAGVRRRLCAKRGPCAAYDGIAGELRAIASQQRRRRRLRGRPDILGAAPAWAAARPWLRGPKTGARSPAPCTRGRSPPTASSPG